MMILCVIDVMCFLNWCVSEVFLAFSSCQTQKKDHFQTFCMKNRHTYLYDFHNLTRDIACTTWD